jgi:ABC-type sugar transport system permease subunit
VSRRFPEDSPDRSEARLAWIFISPAVTAILGVAAFPVLWTLWESLHRHDLRLPWLGMRFVGLANYGEAMSDPRAWRAFGHTIGFVLLSVGLELALGLLLALGLHRSMRGRGPLRTAALLPWAVPTVVAALIWRFMFEPDGLAGAAVTALRLTATPPTWLADPVAAWIPLILADVWKATPFVALLLLAGLQQIDRAVYEAAALDGASVFRQVREITLPLLRPAIATALVFRSLDAFRVFDVVYVLTGGGPGTATEPVSLYAFSALFGGLRIGYGSALSMLVFGLSFVLAMMWIRMLGVTSERAS